MLQKDRTNVLGGHVTFVFEDPAISKFSVVHNSDLTYTAGSVRSDRFAQYDSRTCLTEFGQDPNDCANIQARQVERVRAHETETESSSNADNTGGVRQWPQWPSAATSSAFR